MTSLCHIDMMVELHKVCMYIAYTSCLLVCICDDRLLCYMYIHDVKCVSLLSTRYLHMPYMFRGNIVLDIHIQ